MVKLQKVRRNHARIRAALASAALYVACYGVSGAAAPIAGPSFVLTSGITKPDVPDPLGTFVGKPRWDDAQSLASYCVSDVAGRSIELAKLTDPSASQSDGAIVAPSTISTKAHELALHYDNCSLRVLGNGPIAAFAQFRAAEAYLLAATSSANASARSTDFALAVTRAERAEELQSYFQIVTKTNLVRLQTGGDASITGILVKPWTDAIVAYAKHASSQPPGRRYDF